MVASPSSVRAPDHLVSIMIADDHGLTRDVLRSALDNVEEFSVVGIATNVNEAIPGILTLRPDVVLAGITATESSCFDAIHIIRSRAPSTRIILLATQVSDTHIERSHAAQVNGLVSKEEDIPVLIEAIREVIAGHTFYSPEVMKRLAVHDDTIQSTTPPKTRLGSLSPRERELLRLLAEGLSLKRAANVLGVSYKTADKQKASLMTKLGIHDRVELARFAFREGLVEP